MEKSGDFEGEFSDEFEESGGNNSPQKRGGNSYTNKPYDEAFDVSQDLSVAESYDGRDRQRNDDSGRNNSEREKKLQNDKYDEAVELSQSMDAKGISPAHLGAKGDKGEATVVMNKPFDEALEFSQSGSEESVDTIKSNDRREIVEASPAAAGKSMMPSQSVGGLERPANFQARQADMSAGAKTDYAPTSTAKSQDKGESSSGEDDDDDEEEEDDEDAGAESYDNLEGAYNPKDYLHLDVSADTRDLFGYIDRYKPQEVELDTVLKCFIPEYIPAIGELDPFIKVTRPDGEREELGLKVLDEPASEQSDPTVLELQLRAMSKKQQYGDVVVRSIENASKNTAQIEKWVQSINELHRSKPPPQVHYRKNMPEIDTLMEMWPTEFEETLKKLPLPSPDLALSLGEYSKILCSILDIPVYENPVESLHLMFSLFMAFKENPHFQALANENNPADAKSDLRGGADVMEIKQGEGY